MEKVLIVDDEEPMRRLLRLNLSDIYEVYDTGDPEQALALAMQNKPDVILLDLRMPKFSGFELCRTFSSLTSTQLIPLVVVSGEAGATTKALCKDLGAKAHFEKPINFDALRAGLADLLQSRRTERRSEVRVRLRVTLRLKGSDQEGQPFSEISAAENVGLNSFLGGCAAILKNGAVVDAFLGSREEGLVGSAQVIRSEATETRYPRYAFRFVEKVGTWVLQ